MSYLKNPFASLPSLNHSLQILAKPVVSRSAIILCLVLVGIWQSRSHPEWVSNLRLKQETKSNPVAALNNAPAQQAVLPQDLAALSGISSSSPLPQSALGSQNLPLLNSLAAPVGSSLSPVNPTASAPLTASALKPPNFDPLKSNDLLLGTSPTRPLSSSGTAGAMESKGATSSSITGFNLPKTASSTKAGTSSPVLDLNSLKKTNPTPLATSLSSQPTAQMQAKQVNPTVYPFAGTQMYGTTPGQGQVIAPSSIQPYSIGYSPLPTASSINQNSAQPYATGSSVPSAASSTTYQNSYAGGSYNYQPQQPLPGSLAPAPLSSGTPNYLGSSALQTSTPANLGSQPSQINQSYSSPGSTTGSYSNGTSNIYSRP